MNLRNIIDPATKEGRVFTTVVGPILTIVGLVLTIVGLMLAIYQYRQAVAQEDRITQIANAISTKNIGPFPNNITYINDLIRGTKHSLWVMTDIPAYGQFSNPAGYSDYRGNMDKIAHPKSGIELKLLVYNSERRSQAFADQFKRIEDFKEFQKQDRFKNYFDFWKKTKPVPNNKKELRAILEAEHLDLKCHLAKLGVELHETGTTLPLFVWVSDEKEAIFSFINYPENSSEVSFHTNDKELVNVLLKIVKGIYDTRSEKFSCTRG